MPKLKGYTFDHIGCTCNNDDCIVIESGIDCASGELVASIVYKQTEQDLITLYNSCTAETDDLSVICGRCGAHAKEFK